MPSSFRHDIFHFLKNIKVKVEPSRKQKCGINSVSLRDDNSSAPTPTAMHKSCFFFFYLSKLTHTKNNPANIGVLGRYIAQSTSKPHAFHDLLRPRGLYSTTKTPYPPSPAYTNGTHNTVNMSSRSLSLHHPRPSQHVSSPNPVAIRKCFRVPGYTHKNPGNYR